MLSRSKRYIDKIFQFPHQLPKVKKNEILIIPSNNQLLEYQPYISSSKFPEWWKEQDKNPGSIRRCYGTQDYISLGITLPLWSNVYVRPSPSGTSFEVKIDNIAYAKEYPTFNVEGFPASSVNEKCPFSTQREIVGNFPKLVTPWLYKTAPGYSSLILPMSLEPNPNYEVLPGVVHTDYYHHINIVLVIKNSKEFMIPVGTPMYQIIPFKRSDKTKEITFGNESMFQFYAGRGTGDGYLANSPRKNIYKKLQVKIDSELEQNKNSFVDRIWRNR